MRDNTSLGIPNLEDNSEGRNSELVSTYPIFDEMNLEEEQIYLERSLYSDIPEGEDRFKDEDPRFFLMPSGPILLSSASLIYSQDLWNVSGEDRSILQRLEEFVQEHKGEREPSIFQMGNQRNYRAELFSYDDPASVKRLNDLLENKMRKRRAINK
jgi:hypothetical protein